MRRPGVPMRSQQAVSLLVGLSVLLSPLVGTVLGGDDTDPDGGVRASPFSEWSVDFSVRNTLDQARGPEYVWAEFGVPLGVLFDRARITLIDRDTDLEVRVGLLPGDIEEHEDGSIHRARVHFKDTWAAGETKDYTIVFNKTPTAYGSTISASVQGDFVVVNDGARQYQVHTADSPFKSPQSVYYLYILGGELRAYGTVLTRVGGNQLDPDQASFQMWWGDRTYINVERSDLVNRITLRYDDPVIAHWGPGGAAVQDIVRYPKLISAEVVLTFYQGVPRVDVHSKKTIHERFWNHNGFVMEFSAIRGDGAEWQGEFETVYGTDARVVMTTTTQGPTWTRQSTQWQGIDVASDAAPAFSDLDGDGDLDMVLGSEGQGLKVFQNVGDRSGAVMEENATWAIGLSNVTSATPTLGDLDGDGDAELLVGEAAGFLKLYKNDGGVSGPPVWTRWWGTVDWLGLGAYTAPTFGDADGDGDLDIVLGLGNGTLKGIINTGSASSHSWSMDNRWVDHLSRGLTKAPCDGYSVPFIVDVDYDGDADLLLGSDDGKVIVFENTANRAGDPSWTRLDVSHHAGVVTGSPWESNSTPVMVDIDGDGDRDLLIGNHQGRVYHWSFDGNTTPAKGHNNLQPLENGTYRHIRDKDGNDGPFAVEGYGTEWYDYYVLANPRTGYAAMRYMPDFDRLAYKQEYWGDEFQFAGGNVSYYPYEPVAREYVTRAQITSNPMSDGVSAGTFISQTGTSAGFVMQPMTAMTYESDEVFLLDLQRRTDPADYDAYAAPLAKPLEVHRPLDLGVGIKRWVSDVDHMANVTSFLLTVVNEGPTTIEDVDIRYEISYAKGGISGNETHDGLIDVEPGISTRIVEFDSWSWRGMVDVTVRIDRGNHINETDVNNNWASMTFDAIEWSLPWSDPVTLSSGVDPCLHADAIVRRDGKLYTVWETLRGEEEIDLEGRAFDPTTGEFGDVETLVTDSHYAVEPDLALTGDVLYLAYSSNIEALLRYHQTAHAKYYWGEKFDIWSMQWDTGSWSTPVRVTEAVEADDSDQAPELVYGAGAVRLFYRNTHFQFYTGGNQMNNIPYQEMDLRRASEDGGWDVPNTTVGRTDGSQAWWSGPVAAPEGNGHLWVVSASEIGNTQWDLFANDVTSSGAGVEVRLTNTGSANEFRPAVASNGRTGTGEKAIVMVAYETDRNGNRDIAVRWRDYSGNMAQGWSAERLLTTDPASDMKPTVAYDGHGNYWVAWESERNGNKDIYISRFDGTEWSGPFQVTSSPGSEEEPVLACDDKTGRVYLVYESGGVSQELMRDKTVVMVHMLPRAPALDLVGPVDALEDSPVTVVGTIQDANDDVRWIEWNWGDGNTSLTKGPEGEHVYTRAGEYAVTAKAVDWFGLESAPDAVTVTVRNLAPVAFISGDDHVNEDHVADFTCLGSQDTPSDNGSLMVEWDFGDGTTMGPLPLLEGLNASHVYTTSGEYTVGVIITDDDGDTGTASHVLEVANWIPTVEAWGIFEELEEDEVGEFNGNAVDTPSDEARGLTYRWDWGDGTSSETMLGPHSVHSYSKAGTYNATLVVTDDDGAEGTAVVQVVVLNIRPTIEVSGKTSVDEDGEVALTAMGDDTPTDKATLEYQWDWGDGTVSDWSGLADATHPYSDEGDYRVRVSVRDDDGAVAWFELLVVVSNVKPVAKASASHAVAREGEAVHFTANGTTDTPSDMEDLRYTWDTGTEFFTGAELDLVFKAAGFYTVSLTVTDDDGDISRTFVDVVVTNNPPVTEGRVQPTEVKVGEMVFVDGSNSTDDPWDVGGLEYRWRMGDGTVLVTAEATHTYLLPGTYNVYLEVTDGDGDTSSYGPRTITVLAAGGDDGEDGGGPSMVALGAGVALVVAVLLVVLLVVLRSRGAEGAEEVEADGPAPEDEAESDNAEDAVDAEPEEDQEPEGM